MHTYLISLPPFRTQVLAPNREEALERFWHEYDHAEIALWEKPIIKELTNPE